MIIDIASTVLGKEDSGEADYVRALQLLESFILNLPGCIDAVRKKYIYSIIAHSYLYCIIANSRNTQNDHPSSKFLRNFKDPII